MGAAYSNGLGPIYCKTVTEVVNSTVVKSLTENQASIKVTEEWYTPSGDVEIQKS